MALTVVGGASADLRGARSWWRSPAMLLLGEISYALYLPHYQVILLFDHLVGGRVRAAVGQAATAALLTAVCLGVAWLLYRLVERPLTRRFGSRSGRRADKSPPEPSGAVRNAVRATQTGGSP
ncbi:hypothetical protein ACFQU9_10850 [Actinomadura namibiensis]|uniref:Peptidoglycan/LPS O-acetylase OafA/YrhL n=1 Tax=Actinomadura namibiensis TaxID=182080 RepID=A0A7W3QR81_ACTNM|nr:hypothetical protein [Actinomadura namibiensis]MBA8956396.1 peptidoglycan/LPS O-acetylase OafA/YrhL [Actinomadura namibiensis]